MRYEGEWRDGQEHGVGTLVEPDGSAYYGFWARGEAAWRRGTALLPPPCSFTGLDKRGNI